MQLRSLAARYYAARTLAITEGRKNGVDQTGEKIAPALAACRGSVLEIGAGGGAAIKYLDPTVAYTAIEPNPYLAEAIRASAGERGIASCTVVASGAESLPFAENSFDAVYSLRSLCAVQDLPRALAEVRRVLKPGSMFIFAEHVAAPRGSLKYYLQKIVSYFNPCDLARDIESSIRAAGFSEVQVERFSTGSWRRPVMSLRIAGSARK